MYIGVISDTHGVLDDSFMEFLQPVDEIWHAGDWGGDAGFPSKILSLGKPVVGVCGNCDGFPLRLDYPEYQFKERGGARILMTHIGGYPGKYSPAARVLLDKYKPDIFICGHSHILKVIYDHSRNCLSVNPGACGIQGWQTVRTALRFRVENGEVSGMEVFEYPLR